MLVQHLSTSNYSCILAQLHSTYPLPSPVLNTVVKPYSCPVRYQILLSDHIPVQPRTKYCCPTIFLSSCSPVTPRPEHRPISQRDVNPVAAWAGSATGQPRSTEVMRSKGGAGRPSSWPRHPADSRQDKGHPVSDRSTKICAG